MKKYIILFLFPAFFTISSCTKGDRKVESFEDFSASFEETQELLKENDEKIKKEKKLKKAEEIKSQSEKTKEIENTKAENLEEKLDVGKLQEQPKTTTKITNQPTWLKPFSNKYHLGYLSFDVANFYSELEKEINQEDNYYNLKFYSKTNGFIDYLFGWMSYTTSEFKVTDGKIIPQKFKTKVKLKRKIREIEITYDNSGNIVSENVTPPDNRDKRPAVSDNLKKGTFDPLTIGIEARRLVIKCIKEDNFAKSGTYKFSLPLYDARRRSDILFELFKKRVDGKYQLRLRQKKIAGFTGNELEDENKSDKAYIDIFFDTETYIPLIIQGKSPIGTAKANFVGNCEQGLEKCIVNKK
jgi:hypothetical protein